MGAFHGHRYSHCQTLEHAHGHGHSHGASDAHDHGHTFNIGSKRRGQTADETKDLEANGSSMVSSNSRRISYQEGPLANLSLFPPQAKMDIINAAEILSQRDLADSMEEENVDLGSRMRNGFRTSESKVKAPASSSNKSLSQKTMLGHDHHGESETTDETSHHHDHNEDGGVENHEHKDDQDHHSEHAHDHSSRHSHQGHSHGRKQHSGHLNMQGVFLHVMGDALASIGVIISALIVQFGEGNWKYYADPFISILICAMITSSTIPLVRSAAYILLQGVPQSVPIDVLRDRILELKDVIDVHELHVWQLSDTKAIASVHVIVQAPLTSNGFIPSDYMHIAYEIKQLLHEYGIHSTTVQPEFVYPKGKTSMLINDTNVGSRSTNGNITGALDVVRRTSCSSHPSHRVHAGVNRSNDVDAGDKVFLALCRLKRKVVTVFLSH